MKQNLPFLAASIGLLAGMAAGAQTKVDPSVPHLENRGGATQLVVDGSPFLVLGAELNNSSTSSLEYMKPLWPRLVATHLNTVLATVSWELIEPAEGQFDFTLVDGLIKAARAHDLRLIILWFGSWKNGKSNYQPLWVKTNQERFPLSQNQQGKTLCTLTTLSEANRDADARAFAALMRHLREVDGRQHTVLMVQVENEVGVLEDSRDYSPAANKAFAGPVPKELMDFLQQHKETLILEHQGKGTMTALLLDPDGKPQTVRLGDYNIEARYSSRTFGPVAAMGTPPERVAGLFISTGPDDFVIVGRNMNVYFTWATDPSAGVGLGTVDEGQYVKGRWVPGRRLNGDETPEWKALRFRADYGIQRVRLYTYH